MHGRSPGVQPWESPPDELTALAQFAFFRPHLAELLTTCQDAALGLIVLKGAALAETVYPRPTLRPFGDLDVLVRRIDAERAKAVLESLSYLVDPSVWEDLRRGTHCQANFFLHTERGSVVVELHTDLLNNPLFFQKKPIVSEALWERVQPVRLAGVEASALGPEDQLLHLCLHLAGHYLNAPQSVRDIAQVCLVSAIDWPLWVTLARDAEASAACFCGLFLASRLWGAVVPAYVLDTLAPRVGRSRLEQMALTPGHLRLALLWELLESRERRGKSVGRIAFPSRRWLEGHYGDEFAEGSAPSQAALWGKHMRDLGRRLKRSP